MSEPKWTPGPWQSTSDGGGSPFWIDPIGIKPRGSIATVWSFNAKDNARLIAVAPELYEKLAWLLKRNLISDYTAAFEVEALLAKARGETP